jgi:hypothetical protein
VAAPVLLLAAAALSAADRTPTGCTCAAARAEHGWCATCGTGYVASFAVRSRELHEAIHPHGHPVDAEATACRSCKQAIYADGWCAECRAGYFRGQAYFSRLTHRLARGQSVTPATLTCDTCRHCAARYGWCDACARGFFGSVQFDDRRAYDAITPQAEIFFAALARSTECELCAVAMITDARCTKCRITYQDGKPVSAQAERQTE